MLETTIHPWLYVVATTLIGLIFALLLRGKARDGYKGPPRLDLKVHFFFKVLFTVVVGFMNGVLVFALYEKPGLWETVLVVPLFLGAGVVYLMAVDYRICVTDESIEQRSLWLKYTMSIRDVKSVYREGIYVKIVSDSDNMTIPFYMTNVGSAYARLRESISNNMNDGPAGIRKVVNTIPKDN